MPSTYATNVVTAKLIGLVGSPPELILGVAVFNELSDLYAGWRCWVHSASEFQTLTSENRPVEPNTLVLVPQFAVADVGRVDFAIFAPDNRFQPLVAVECDGHDFHERTPDQASNDKRRDRVLQSLGIPVFRFTGSDILRNSVDFAREIVRFVHVKLHENAAREAERAQLESVEAHLLWYQSGALR